MSTDYSGMTLNERLYIAGLMEEFDSAVKKKNRERLLEILKEVALNVEEAEFTISTIFQDPKKYGH